MPVVVKHECDEVLAVTSEEHLTSETLQSLLRSIYRKHIDKCYGCGHSLGFKTNLSLIDTFISRNDCSNHVQKIYCVLLAEENR